jgi:predicted transcriptional regulator
MAKFTWTPEKEIAAMELSVGGKANYEVAELLGVTPVCVAQWKQKPEFQERMKENFKEFRQRVMSEGIADRINRIKRLNLRWNQLNSVFEKRAKDPFFKDSVPGWDTGLMTHEQKSIGSGDLATVIDVYRVDVATIKEEREIAKQAAQELGQWEEKTRHTIDTSLLTDEELEVLERVHSRFPTQP